MNFSSFFKKTDHQTYLLRYAIVGALLLNWLASSFNLWGILGIEFNMMESLHTHYALTLIGLLLIWLFFRISDKKTNLSSHLPHHQALFYATLVWCLDFLFTKVYIRYFGQYMIDYGQSGQLIGQLLYTNGTWAACLYLLNISFIGPLFEELFCRKILMKQFFSDSPYYLDVIFSSLIFALGHVYLDIFNVAVFFYYFIPSLLYAFLYRKTGRISYTILLHILFNLYVGLGEWMHFFDHLLFLWNLYT